MNLILIASIHLIQQTVYNKSQGINATEKTTIHIGSSSFITSISIITPNEVVRIGDLFIVAC